MKRYILAAILVVLLPVLSSAQIVLDTNDYVTISSKAFDSTAWLFNAPDSVRIMVVYRGGLCFDQWFEAADSSCNLLGSTGMLSWYMKVKDIDADSGEGMYDITAEFYDIAPRSLYDRKTLQFYKNNGGIVDMLYGADSTGYGARTSSWGYLAIHGGSPALQATPQDLWRGIDTIHFDTVALVQYLVHNAAGSGIDSATAYAAAMDAIDDNLKIDLIYDTVIVMLDSLQLLDDWVARQTFISMVRDTLNKVYDSAKSWDGWVAQQLSLAIVNTNVLICRDSLRHVDDWITNSKLNFDTNAYLMGYVFNSFSRSVYYTAVDSTYIRAPSGTYIAVLIRYINPTNGLPDSTKLVRI